MKKIVISFGRMNPPTVGHQKLVDKVVAVGKSEKAEARVYLSHTQNKKKDPLDYATKIRYAQKAFGPIVTNSPHKTIFQILEDLNFNGGYTDVVVVVGSDRVNEFKQLLNKYNGKNYNYDSIKIVSAGERDPDADDVSGMSASKLRGLAMEGKFAEFKKGLPPKLQSIAKPIYDKLRSIMEEEQLDEYAVLNLQQRLKRARTMKRIAKKVARKRAIQAKRMADQARLTKRSRKKALQFIRKRVAGERGKNYKELSASEKMTIDKLVAKKSAIIDKLAKRLMPKVRKAEVERLARARSIKKEESEMKTFSNLFEVKQDTDIKDREGTQPAKYHSGVSKSTKEKRDAAFKSGAEKSHKDPSAYPDKHPGDVGVQTKMSKHTKKYQDMFGEKKMYEEFELTEASEGALRKKAEKSGIPYSILKKVYDRGMAAWRTGHRPGAGQEQWAYARVNSFITKGKGTWGGADKDLAAKVNEELEEACWSGYEQKGMKKKGDKMVPNCVPKKEQVEEGIGAIIRGITTRVAGKTSTRPVEPVSPASKVIKKPEPDVTFQKTKKEPSPVYDKPINELSNELLGRYKKKAGEDASAADKKGDFKRGNKRFSGIMKATKKQFNNDMKEDGYQWKDFSDAERTTIKARQDAIGGSRVNKTPQAFNSASLENRKKLADILRAKPKPTTAADLEPQPRVTPAEIKDQPSYGAKVMKPVKEEFDKMLEDADRTIDRLRWADVPQMEPLKRMSNNQLKGYVRDYVSKNSDQVRKFMGAADSGMFGRTIIQKMAPKYIPATKGMTDKDWSNAWKAYDNIDPKIKSNLKKGDTSDFQTNSYVKEDTGSVQHHQFQKTFKHAMKHAQMHQDLDMDGDVDVLDKMANNPDEFTAAEKNAALIQKSHAKKQELEKTHTRVGVAFEAVSPEKSKKTLKDILPKSGAGQMGTDELVKNYLAQTPGMTIEGYCPDTGDLKEELVIEEAEHEGKKVKLNDPFRLPAGSKKKFGVYVKNDKGNVVKVTFGDPNMEIKRDDPKRRAAFRSRHSCDDNIGPKWKARYWSCYQWRAGKKVDN